MIKKDIKFIENYEKNRGTITFNNQICCVFDEDNEMREIHKLSEDTKIMITFPLEDFYIGYKRVHGTKHLFTLTHEGLNVYIKKDSSFVETISLNSLKTPDNIFKTPSQLIGTISSKSLSYFQVLEKMTTPLEYLNFFQHPTFICQDNELYFWGTDCIHQLKLNGTSKTRQNHAYHLSKESCKKISKFVSGLSEDMRISIETLNNSSIISFQGVNHTFICPLIHATEAYLCEVEEEKEYRLSQEELEELKSIGLKKRLPQAKQEVKESFEVVIEVVNGEICLQKEKVLKLSKNITLCKPIEAYRFVELLQLSKEIILSTNYIHFDETLLIL